MNPKLRKQIIQKNQVQKLNLEVKKDKALSDVKDSKKKIENKILFLIHFYE